MALSSVVDALTQEVRIIKALADPMRLRIMLLLQRNGEMCVCDLTEALAMPQSSVSRHLSTLRGAGLAGGERRGVWMYYRVDASGTLGPELLAALQRHAADSTLAREDQERFAAYRQGKTASSCAVKR